jgi:glycosyltransferase involved in cell wall biosynthesis
MLHKDNLRLSIVIPVYNEAESLGRCLEAIAGQTTAPYEVIIVDNNSTDRTSAVARRYNFARVIDEPRQGIVYARSSGFDAARGDIIGRIDADSLLPSDWVEHIVDFYQQNSAHAGYAFSGGASFYNVRFPRAVAWLYNFLAFDLNHLLIGHPTLWGSNMAITRQQWQAVRSQTCARLGIHEDLDLAMHLTDLDYRIFYDRHFRITAHMRRVRSDRHELWEYLQWWPRTLRRHGKRNWWLCWLCGCLMLYLLTPLLSLSEYLARLVGRPPLRESLGTERV